MKDTYQNVTVVRTFLGAAYRAGSDGVSIEAHETGTADDGTVLVDRDFAIQGSQTSLYGKSRQAAHWSDEDVCSVYDLTLTE